MRLSTRLFLASSLLVVGTVVALLIATDRILRSRLETDMAASLEREARLIAAALPADSTQWPAAARQLGALLGHRVTLVDARGRVRGDADFDVAALARLENHLSRPEIRDALAAERGTAQRLSASTNERQLYVAVRGGPAGLAVTRVSTTLAVVDAEMQAIQRAIAGAGILAVLAAAVLAWLLSRALARPLVQLAGAARAIASGTKPDFPTSRVPEIAQHIHALRAMHGELTARFDALSREREETRTLIESMNDGVIAANPRGAITSCNAAARRLLRRGPTDGLPPLGELFHDKPARDLLREVLAGKDIEQRELALDGRFLLVTGRTLPDGGTLLVLRDISELRRLETVRRDFVANVSHELRTPLTSIAGYAETLAAEVPPDGEAHRFAATILANARRMQRLVDDLLDLSRIEAGAWRPAREVVEVEIAARDAWTMLAGQKAVDLSFEVEVAPEAHALLVDPDALRQIFTNLFENALRHTPPGGRVRVTAAQSGDGVAISVSDTGSGIPAEHLSRIFERFYRVDPGRARHHGGTGLGLAIVKHLVEAHGGRVDAESVLGQGTNIRMVFLAELPTP